MRTQENYFKELSGKKVILVDFDNTIVYDSWPYIGGLIPGAIEVLKKLQEEGHRIILWTQRTKEYPVCCKELEDYSEAVYGKILDKVDLLTPALNLLEKVGIRVEANQNTPWESSTGDHGRKVFNDFIIDDHSVGMKLIDGRCDWDFIKSWCIDEGLIK